MTNLLTRLTLTAALSTAALLGASNQHFTEISDAAQRTQTEARSISAALKTKNPNLTSIRTQLTTLENHATELSKMVEAIQADGASLTGTQKVAFERMTMAAKIVSVFVENKKNLMDGVDAGKSIALLRAKADGIALRADMVQKSAARLKT
ncbi:MAG: hypothetical protein SGI92_03150 [Bryobacteraceae bacterium]|nr:hypothetical protein [Bryobacteraceae bacterium]